MSEIRTMMQMPRIVVGAENIAQRKAEGWVECEMHRTVEDGRITAVGGMMNVDSEPKSIVVDR